MLLNQSEFTEAGVNVEWEWYSTVLSFGTQTERKCNNKLGVSRAGVVF